MLAKPLAIGRTFAPQAGGSAIDQLTSLRFFAALAVMLSHLVFLGQNDSPQVTWLFNNLFYEGYSGVSFFYILSGFIISHAYGDRLESRQISQAQYFRLRLVRIVPLHWMVALPFVAWLLAKGDMPDPVAVMLNLSLLHAFAPQSALHYSLNGPSWSLSCELFFYAMFPLLVTLRTRILAILSFAAACMIVGAAGYWVANEAGYSATAEWLFYVAPPVRLLDFMVGMLLYRGWRNGLFARQAGTRAEILLVALIPVLMALVHVINLPMPFRWQLAYLPPMAALILIFAHGRGAISRALQSPPLILLGEASFALYLTHRPIITLAHQFSEKYLSGGWDVPLAAALLIGCTLFSVMVFSWVDKPMQRRLRMLVAHFASKRSPSSASKRMGTPSKVRTVAISVPLLLAIGIVAAGTAQQQPQPRAAAPSPSTIPATRIGLNLYGIDTYNRQQVFTNLIAQSDWFSAEGGGWTKMEDSQLDDRGWVKYLKAGQVAPRPLILPPAPLSAVAVRCTFAGDGEISVGGIAHETERGSRFLDFDIISRGGGADEGAWIQLDRTNPADPLRDIDCRDRTRPASEIFHPELPGFLRGFSVIRFLDWQQTNSNLGETWAQRTRVTDSSQTAAGGVAIEHMVDLANLTGIDPWFLMPYKADAAYIENFARLVHDRIAPDRTVHVELGNEIWNDGFDAARQARREGLEMGLDPGGDPMRAQMRRYAQKSRQALQIWTRVFADRPAKLVRVVSSLNVYPDVARMILDYEDTAQWVDALATAPYITLDLAGRGAGDEVWAFSQLDAAVDETIDFAAQNKAIAASYGKRFITYEGGQHIVTTDLGLASQIQRDPRMGDVYRRYLNGWKTRVGDTLMLYASTAPVAVHGSWGLREYAGQPLPQAPKLQAVRQFMDKNR